MRRGRPPVSLRDAPEAALIAKDLIYEHHPHLFGVRIDCCFRSETQKNKGKLVLGSCAKTTVREEFLGRRKRDAATGEFTAPEHYFVISIAEPEWKKLSDPQRIALIDHELHHAGVTETDAGDRKLKILPHDIEEFSAVVRRHGLWKGDIEEFVRSAQLGPQLALDVVDGGRVDETTGEVHDAPNVADGDGKPHRNGVHSTVVDVATGEVADMDDSVAVERVLGGFVERALARR